MWTVWAISGSLLAEHKNRRKYAWALLCVWFGPFALIVLACLKQRPGYDGQSTLRKYTRLDDGPLDGYILRRRMADEGLYDTRYGDAHVE